MDNNNLKLEDGFLDLKLNVAIPVFREEHKSDYLVVLKVKSFLDELQNCFVDKTVSEQDKFLAASIVELNKLFQSAVLLYERGLPESANIVVRSILELSFKIIESVNNKDFLKEMIFDVNSNAIKTLNDIKNNEFYDIVPKDRLNKLLSDCQHLESQNGKINIRAYNLAQRNKMLREYILYRIYCDYPHQSLKVIDEIVDYTPDGVNLNGDLRLEDFSQSIAMLISITMISFPKILEHSLIDGKLKVQFDLLQKEFEKTYTP